MVRWFSDVRQSANWRQLALGIGLIGVGVAGVGGATWAYYDSWQTRQSWESSPEAAALQRQIDAPTPVFLAPATPVPAAEPTQVIAALPSPSLAPVETLLPLVPTPVVTATADQLSLDATDFRFLDPPEPGAHARIAFSVANHADAPSGRILLGIDSSWFDSYTIIGTAPAISRDSTDPDSGLRTFSFPPVAAGTVASYELHVSSTAEGTTPPTVTVLSESGDTIGEVDTPRTFAPTPRPGPVMSIEIPRLKLKSAVKQVAFEPPPFVVGQLEDSAHVTQGNTVLVGHLTGLAGNVFAHLDELQPGDEITATSRGLPYKFVVTESFEGANTDATPMTPDDDAHLTLMTCAGVWNPFTQEYSKRLWVIAQPPDEAAVTIANAQATATVVSATATAQATLDAQATATAVALEPTATPVPTPYAGEPALPGGLGNSRANLEHAFGYASGETGGKLVVFRQADAELHVRLTPDPQRATLIALFPRTPLPFDAAVSRGRKLFPSDTLPTAASPEGNGQFIVEHFASASLAQALSPASSEFSVVYTRDANGQITSIVLAPVDDPESLIAASRQ